MFAALIIQLVVRVALLAEGVGRNIQRGYNHAQHLGVALLAEGVGRNWTWRAASARSCQVALLAEGVGRNSQVEGIGMYCPCRPPRGGRG